MEPAMAPRSGKGKSGKAKAEKKKKEDRGQKSRSLDEALLHLPFVDINQTMFMCDEKGKSPPFFLTIC